VRHLKRLSLYVVVAVALGASGVSVASAALPEFVGSMPLAFSSTLKATTLETLGGLKITCTGGSNAGEVTGPKALTVKIKLEGCMLNGLPCASSAAGGEIETFPLTGTLGYIKQATKNVGLDLAQPAGAAFMTFVCGEDLRVVVDGSVVGTIRPINKNLAPPKHFTIKFAQKKGKQKPTKLEGAPEDVLSTSLGGGPFEVSGLASSDELDFVGPLMIAG
jgi:hypothetical protein